MPKIEDFYFHLYAVRRRVMVANGYPSKNPIYDLMDPPLLGSIYDKKDVIYEDDWDKAAIIERHVNNIRREKPKYAYYLDIWEGAYPYAPASKSKRCEEWRVKYGTCKKGAINCKKEVERRMYG